MRTLSTCEKYYALDEQMNAVIKEKHSLRNKTKNL